MLPGFTAWQVRDPAPVLRAARPDRSWMDRFTDRHPYRCLPLSMANSTGWELLCPCDIEADWTGGGRPDAVKVAPHEPKLASGHFGRGVLTFDAGYLFRTPPGWGMWVMGPPNLFKANAQPMQGLVETDWLPFTFTMNWQMEGPGKVTFRAGEPFAFIMPVMLDALVDTQPVIRRIEEDADLHAEYQAWRTSRDRFNGLLAARDAEATQQGWQKHYMRGETVTGGKAGAHRSKRRLREPVNHADTAPA